MSGHAGRGTHGQVVDELGERIVSGRLEPENRTVLREALKLLAAKGLVDARQKRGTFVLPRARWQLLDADVLRWQFSARPTAELLGQLAEVRAIVEPAGARLAAQRRDDTDLAELADAVEAMAASTSDTAVEADLRFHRALLVAPHNELPARMEAVIEVGLAARDALMHGGHDASVEGPVPTHRAVFEAVRAGDPDAAEHAVCALLGQAERDAELVGETE